MFQGKVPPQQELSLELTHILFFLRKFPQIDCVLRAKICTSEPLISLQSSVHDHIITDIFVLHVVVKKAIPLNLWKNKSADLLFRHVHKIVKSGYQLYHVCPSVHPHGTTWLPLNRFSSNFLLEYFSKICPENSSFIKI